MTGVSRKAKSAQVGIEQVIDIADRRLARRAIGAAESHAVLSASDDWRFYYTIKEIAEFHEVWFAHKPDESFISFSKGDTVVMPFWPHEDIAIAACRVMSISCQTHPMSIDVWIDEFLDMEFRKDGCLVALCPANFSAWPARIDEVLATLSEYLSDKEAYWARHFSNDTFKLTMNMRIGPKGRLP